MKKQHVKTLSLKRDKVSNFQATFIKGGISGAPCQPTYACVPFSVGCPDLSANRTGCCLTYQLSCICN